LLKVAEERFPLPGSSYRELTKIIQGYSSLKGPGGPGDVGSHIGIDPTIVSRNNKFLGAIEVVFGGQKKTLTEPGRALAMALEHDLREEIVTGWRRVLEGNEFTDKILSAVRIRKGMERSALQAHVAFTAGHPRKPMTMTGAATVVDILLAGELLHESDGKLEAATAQELSQPTAPEVRGSETEAGSAASKSATALQTIVHGVPVQIQIQLQCTPDQLDDLGAKLRRLLNELRSPDDSISS
jgi:hypothetical protein